MASQSSFYVKLNQEGKMAYPSSYGHAHQFQHEQLPSWPQFMSDMQQVAYDISTRARSYPVTIEQRHLNVLKKFSRESGKLRETFNSMSSELNALRMKQQPVYSLTPHGTYVSQDIHQQGAGGVDDWVQLQAENKRLKEMMEGKDLHIATLESRLGMFEQKSRDSNRPEGYWREFKSGSRQDSQAAAQIQKLTSRLDEAYGQLKEKEMTLEDLKFQIDKLTLSNSQLMHGKMSSSEVSTENVNIVNRPSQVVEEYQDLLTGAWLDAKQELETRMSGTNEMHQFKALNIILLVAKEVSDLVVVEYSKKISKMLESPVSFVLDPSSSVHQTQQYQSNEKSPRGKEVGKEDKVTPVLRNELNNILKQNCDLIDLTPLIKLTIDRVKSQIQSQNVLYFPHHLLTMTSTSPLMRYVRKACLVCWKMAIQQPPLQLYMQGEGQTLDPNSQEQYFESRPGANPVVEYYVKPALINDQRCLVKGIVYLGRGR